MHEHLAGAEQAARKDRNADDVHVPFLRHQETGHRKFADIEFLVVKHALVAMRAVSQGHALADLEHLEANILRWRHRLVEKREMAIVTLNRYRQCHRTGRGHSTPQVFCRLTTQASWRLIWS